MVKEAKHTAGLADRMTAFAFSARIGATRCTTDAERGAYLTFAIQIEDWANELRAAIAKADGH